MTTSPIAALILLHAVAAPAVAQEFISIQIVLQARPSSVTVVTDTSAVRQSLSEDGRADAEVRVLESRGHYWWASRDNCALERRDEGPSVTFVGVDCEGYVRVLDQRGVPAGTARRLPGADFQYIEHRIVGLETRTFYGSAERFDP